MNSYRIDLTKSEYVAFKEYVNLTALERAIKDINDKRVKTDGHNVFEIILNKINNPKIIKYSDKKISAILNATKIRSNRVKEKINNAINILRMENKKFTHYNIAKTGNISFVTVQKYISKEILEKLNQKELKKIY